MKLNWGQGLAIAIVLAISGILFLVFITTRQSIDLVVDDYYPKELKYEEQIQKAKNNASLSEDVKILMENEVLIVYPKLEGHHSLISGEIWFYRPSDKSLDKKFAIALDSLNTQRFSKELFKDGKYEAIIEWTHGGKDYLSKLGFFISK